MGLEEFPRRAGPQKLPDRGTRGGAAREEEDRGIVLKGERAGGGGAGASSARRSAVKGCRHGRAWEIGRTARPLTTKAECRGEPPGAAVGLEGRRVRRGLILGIAVPGAAVRVLGGAARVGELRAGGQALGASLVVPAELAGGAGEGQLLGLPAWGSARAAAAPLKGIEETRGLVRVRARGPLSRGEVRKGTSGARGWQAPCVQGAAPAVELAGCVGEGRLLGLLGLGGTQPVAELL